ncbi:MAG: YceD family protein [Fibrobacterota bacterium]
MIISIRTLPFGHSTCEQDVVFRDERAEAAVFMGPVRCRAEVDRMQKQIFLQVEYAVTVRLECARCLEVFDQKLTGSFGALIEHRTSADVSTGEDGEADAYYEDEDDEIDIGQVVYDELMTNISIMPLCSSDCAGIKIEKEEETFEDTIDPRWEKLKKLREKNE